MQPQLQTSMEGPYLSSPSSSSGGLYQRVITLLVYGLSLSSALYSLQVKHSQSPPRTFPPSLSPPRQTEVGQLDLALVVDEDVAALDVSVEEVPVVAVRQPLHYLSHYRAVQLLQAQRLEDYTDISRMFILPW